MSSSVCVVSAHLFLVLQQTLHDLCKRKAQGKVMRW
jgi:hypothetical protein